jgi:hypothetical protein
MDLLNQGLEARPIFCLGNSRQAIRNNEGEKQAGDKHNVWREVA